MNKQFLILFLSLMMQITFFAQDPKKYTTHVVKEGETLKSISKLYNCKVKEIEDLNPDVNENKLHVNITLLVPNPNWDKNKTEIKTVTPTKSETINQEKVTIHIVEQGNTLFSIAKEYNVTMQSIKDANALQDEDLKLGQKLRIPSKKEFMQKPSESKVEFYQVQKGDTKWGIATRYKISVDELNAINPELKGDDVKEGSYIWVPSKIVEIEQKAKGSTQQSQEQDIIYHVVKEGEGLFRIAVLYSTTQEEIEKLNPEAVKLLRPGMLIKIPGKKKDKFLTHNVEKGDTVYNITNKYNITEKELLLLNPDLKEGLKLGTLLYIKPIGGEKTNNDLPKVQEFKTKNDKTILVSFLMPIMLDSVIAFGQKTTESKLRTIVTDFYMGAQMAISDLQNKGFDIEYHIYDTKNDFSTINKILKIDDVKNSNLIIGDIFYDKAEYIAQKYPDTPIIIPFYTKKQEANTQFNLIKAGVNEKNTGNALANFIVKKRTNQKIVLIADFVDQNNGDLKTIETLLDAKKIDFQTIRPTQNEKNPNQLSINKTSIQNALSKDKETWVILMSENNSVINDVISTYGMLETAKIRLFSNDYFDKIEQYNFNHLVQLNWTFVTPYHSNFNNSTIANFNKTYKELNKGLPNEYAYQGYDITLDIIKRLATGDLNKSLEKTKTSGLTTVFDYQKHPEKGFINNGLMFVKINQNYEFEIID